MQLGATFQGFRILSVVNGTNWKSVPLDTSFDLEHRPRGTPLVGICGDTGPTITLQYRDGIVEYDHRPTAESLNQWYRSQWMGQSLEQVKATALAVAHQQPSGVRLELLAGLSNLDTAVDVGAGYGDQVRSLQAIAKTVTVIEPCEVRAQALREVYGCNTLHGSFPDVKCDADLIVCHHVIEHVRDAEQVFSAFAECQKDGGRLVITCPNFVGEPKMGVCLFWPHLRSFTDEGILRLAGRYGYHQEMKLSTDSQIATRFVKGEPVEYQNPCFNTESVVYQIREGLGLLHRRLLIWERDYSGAIHVGSEHLAMKQKYGGIGRCIEITDLFNRRTDCPIEIQWSVETQVFVK